MGLVNCKECGREVSDKANTCPGCGIDSPGVTTGTLIITRLSKTTGIMYDLQIDVDGITVGSIGDGEAISLVLASGLRHVEISGGGLSNDASIQIEEGATHKYSAYFSNWGILGGGLKFQPS